MNSRLVLPIAAVVAAVGNFTWSALASASESQWVAGPPPPANSCAIHCPADAPAYPGKSGAVVCGSRSTPRCQCQDESQPMAYCPNQEGGEK